MNHIATHVERPVDWFHLPVPIDRDDTGYFEPLTGLEAGDETAIYLGLVHARDGVDGALRRANSAAKSFKGFGIATECGFGRPPPESVVPLLQLQVEIAERLDAAGVSSLGRATTLAAPEVAAFSASSECCLSRRAH